MSIAVTFVFLLDHCEVQVEHVCFEPIGHVNDWGFAILGGDVVAIDLIRPCHGVVGCSYWCEDGD